MVCMTFVNCRKDDESKLVCQTYISEIEVVIRSKSKVKPNYNTQTFMRQTTSVPSRLLLDRSYHHRQMPFYFRVRSSVKMKLDLHKIIW